MNRPRVRFNDRKCFACAATLVAVLGLLAGGANALANTVWCVPSATLNPACTALTTKPHIQVAVTAAASGDVIVVGPGTYNESVNIPSTKTNLTLQGAQAGRDAREGRHDSARESIVDATGQSSGPGGGAAFYVAAKNVVIDGFTIQGGTGGDTASGIYVTPGVFPTGILNNIIQNNAVGVFLDTAFLVLVKHNLFETNNAGEAGSSESIFAGLAGFGVAVNGDDVGTAIVENAFEGNLAAAIDVDDGQFMAITGNTSKNDGSFAVFMGGGLSFISHNQGRDFGAKGLLGIANIPLPSYPDAAILAASTALVINDNDLEEGKTPNYHGIAFTTYFEPHAGPSELCQVANNKIRGFTGNGIVAEASSGTGELVQSQITGNIVVDNGNDGILIEAATLFNANNLLMDNRAEGNGTYDCEDDTIGSAFAPPVSGTLGTANTWSHDIGISNSPAGLCTQPQSPVWQ